MGHRRTTDNDKHPGNDHPEQKGLFGGNVKKDQLEPQSSEL